MMMFPFLGLPEKQEGHSKANDDRQIHPQWTQSLLTSIYLSALSLADDITITSGLGMLVT